MTDPERISKRSRGLAAQLLQAGAEEQPAEASVQQTLAALGASAAVVSAAGSAGAVAGSAKGALGAGAGAGTATVGGTAAGGAVKVVSATLLMKWVGIGVVGGVGLAGAAAVASGPAVSPPAFHAVVAAPAPAPEPVLKPAPATPELLAPSTAVEAPVVAVPTTPSTPAPHVGAGEPVTPAPVLEIGAPLAAEVAYVDRARALLASGQVEPGLALLRSYERDFPEARLLPEVLFLQLETCDRLGRASEARSAARRLLDGFPKSPHASRARKLLFP